MGDTKFLESEAILAAQDDDNERLFEILNQMTKSELFKLERACARLEAQIEFALSRKP